ncbi:MAG: TauD/TfdA family dioxygenase [Azospirillaceae bacterium]
MSMQIRPLSEHTGSEITGLDIRTVFDDEPTKERLRREFAERNILVFRDQDLDPQAFQTAGEIFGETMPQQVERFTLKDHPLVGFVSSEDTDKPGGKRLVRGEQYHTDHSNFPVPPKATILYGVTIPSQGGDTQFVNTHAAYDDLPDEMKRQIDPLKVLHIYLSSRSPRRKAELTEEERKRIPEAWQPLVLEHPDNHRKALYLNTAHMERIEGLGEEEGFELINRLMAHVTQPKFEYRHKWRKGDFVIWDNRSVLHQANADYDEPRFLFRLMLKGVPLSSPRAVAA